MIDVVNIVDTIVFSTELKLECAGHHQKRLGTRLRNLRKREQGLGGRCRLTNTTTDRL